MELKNYFAPSIQGARLKIATCYLYYSGTTTLATEVYDAAGDALPNPFTSDRDGFIQFSAPNGSYDLTLVNGTISNTIPVEFIDQSSFLRTVDDYTALRNYDGVSTELRVSQEGIAGQFVYDATDTTSVDDGGIVIVGNTGRRWKRIYDGPIHAQWFGLVGDGVIDETPKILAALNAVEIHGGDLIVQSINPTDPIYINSSIPIEVSNFTLKYASPLLYGPDATQRINGGLAEVIRTELGQTNSLKLRANSTTDAEGRMVLPLSAGHGAFVMVGDRIVIRGENDFYGKPYDKQITTIISVVGDDVTCADEPDATFQPTYPDSEWLPDLTTGTTIAIAAYSPMTVDAAPGDLTVTVADTTFFAVGDLCYINDARTEADMMLPVVSTLRSQCNMEIAKVVAKTATTITFDRPLLREYLAAWDGGVTKMDPVVNTHIITSDIEWAAPQPNRKNSCLAINYSERCSIKSSGIFGKQGRVGAAVRVGYSYDCHIVDTRVYDAYSFNSAEGYGLTLYYSTLCSIKNSVAVGGRHNFLLQTATLCEISDNYSGDDYISGIDLHGANSVGTRISRNIVTRSVNHAPGVTNGGGIRIGNTSHTLGDHDTIIESNWVTNYSGALHCAIDVSPSSRNTMVLRNTIIDCQIGFRHYKVGSTITPAQHVDRVSFIENTLIRVVELLDFENYTDNSYWDELIFIGNKAFECASPFVVRDIPKVTFRDNKYLSPVYAAGVYAYEFYSIADLHVGGNSTDGTDRGLYYQNCPGARLVKNDFGNIVSSVAIQDGGGNTGSINVGNTDSSGSTGTITTAEITNFEEATTDLIGSSILSGGGMTVTFDDVTGKTTLTATSQDSPTDYHIVPLGDSRSAQNWSYTSLTRPAPLARGWLWWAETLSGRVHLESDYRQGVSGDEVGQIRARIEANTLNDAGYGPNDIPANSIIAFLAGTNNATGAIDKAYMDAVLVDHKWCVDWALGRGHKVIVIAEWPRTGLTANEQKMFQYYVQSLKSMYRNYPGVWVVDVWPEASLPSDTTGAPIANILDSDGLHNSPGIAYVTGKKIAEVLELMGLPVIQRRTGTNADLYDATYNPRGNLVQNPMLQGSAGTVSTNATGVAPDGWTLDASAGLSVVGSRETISVGGVDRDAFKMVISGTPTTTNGYARLRRSGLQSLVATGNVLEAGHECLVMDGHTNFAAPGGMIDPGVSAERAHAGLPISGDSIMPPAVVEGFYGNPKTTRYTVPATPPASLAVEVRSYFTASGVSSSLTIYILSCYIRKVNV